VAGTRRWARRATAALLNAAVAWPSTASAASPAAPEAEAPEVEAPPTETEAPPTEAAPTEAEAKDAPEPSEPTPRVLAPSDPRPDEAARHWQAGRALYDKGSYAEAAAEFELSYAAVPFAATLYSVGVSYERAGKPVEAVRAFRRYLELPDCPDAPPEEPKAFCTAQRSEAEQALEELRPRVGELAIELGEGVKLSQVKVAGRTVPLDDFPLVLLPGTIDVEVFGLRPNERRTRSVTIVGGEPQTFYVAPFEEPSVVVPPPRPTPEVERDDERDDPRLERRRRGLRTTFWVGTGLTAGSAVAMAVMGGLTLYHRKQFRQDLCGEVCEDPDAPPYPEDHELAFERYQPITNALVGVTVGLSVATALVGTFAFRKRPDAGKAGTRARTRPSVRMGASGLVVRW
jgi:hypothetical protein